MPCIIKDLCNGCTRVPMLFGSGTISAETSQNPSSVYLIELLLSCTAYGPCTKLDYLQFS